MSESQKEKKRVRTNATSEQAKRWSRKEENVSAVALYISLSSQKREQIVPKVGNEVDRVVSME